MMFFSTRQGVEQQWATASGSFLLVLQQPMRAKHCQLCQHCVRRYDHHCPWIENCVGEKNHPLFIVYLSVQLIVLLWGAHVAW